MAKASKKRFHVMRNTVLAALVFLVFAAFTNEFAENVMVFMLTGIIAGTPYVIPVWGMYILYGGIACFFLLTYLLDYELEYRHGKKSVSHQLPRRRYSHI